MTRPLISGLREMVDAATPPTTVETIAGQRAPTTSLIADGDHLFAAAIHAGYVWCERCGMRVAATARAIRAHQCKT
jgi:hypothetical protein